MKTKFLLLGAALSLAACGSSSDAGWKADDLRYVTLVAYGEGVTYVDTQKGGEAHSVSAGSLFYDGFAVASSDDGYYFLDRDFQNLTSDVYFDVTIFHDGIAWAVKPGGPLTAIDKKGEALFELKRAETACAFHEGLAVFADAEGKWGVVDKRGIVVVEPQWADVVPMYVNGLIAVKSLDGLWGLVNRKGEIVVNCVFKEIGTKNYEKNFLYNYVQALHEGRIPVKDENNKWGIIDRKGRLLINPQFEAILLDGKNYLFRKGRLYGWCDKEGHYLINPQFESAVPFGGGDLAAVEDEGDRWGFIDKEGKWVINPQFREAGSFLDCGVAPVKDAGSREWGAIDKEGKYVINPQFQMMFDYGAPDKILVMDQSRMFGIVGVDGEYIIFDYPDAPQELLNNVSGIAAKYKAQSDYVDVETYAALIDAEIQTLKATTTGGLKAIYGLTDAKFPKNGGDVTLYKKAVTSDMTFKLVVAGVKAWNRASDGWFGYNFTFLPDVPVTGYMLSVEFSGKGKAWRFVGEIFDVLKQKYAYDEENGTLAVPGCELVFAAAIPNGGMIFHVKPETK